MSYYELNLVLVPKAIKSHLLAGITGNRARLQLISTSGGAIIRLKQQITWLQPGLRSS